MIKFKLKRNNYITLFVFAICCIVFYKLTFKNNTENTTSTNKNKLINLNELFAYGKCLVEKSGKKIVDIKKSNNLQAHLKDKDQSIVTKADIISHEILAHSLKMKYNLNLNIMSEENTDDEINIDVTQYYKECDNYVDKEDDIYLPTHNLTVWVDPLDATQEYSEDLVDYVTIMFCIAIDGKPRASIIHHPFSDKTDWTWINKETYLNPSSADKHETSKAKKIVVSRSHAGKVSVVIGEKQKELKDAQVIVAAGAGYKSLKVANKEADLYLHTTKIYKWDLCAGNAIINNLNGKMSDIHGNEIDYSFQTESDNKQSIDGVIASISDYDYYFKLFSINK